MATYETGHKNPALTTTSWSSWGSLNSSLGGLGVLLNTSDRGSDGGLAGLSRTRDATASVVALSTRGAAGGDDLIQRLVESGRHIV
jgi:hypothetical protein